MVAPVVAGCQFSFSAGGPDYEKLETAIADELNTQYSAIDRQVDTVECPRPSESPKAGSSFNCVADLEGNDVRVEVKFTDDDYNVDFATLDVVYDLAETSKGCPRTSRRTTASRSRCNAVKGSRWWLSGSRSNARQPIREETPGRSG